MNKLILALILVLPFYIKADFDNKCSVIITLRFQSNEDAYKDAINKINQCEKYDILSVTSFLEESISKVYITDLIQNYCMFNHQIITLIDDKTSNLSCVHRGKPRVDRQLKSLVLHTNSPQHQRDKLFLDQTTLEPVLN